MITHDSENLRYYVKPQQLTVQILGKDKKYGDRYETSMLITDLSMGECRIHFVQGHLNNEMNLAMVEVCQKLGFKRIQLEVPTGTNASRHATLQWSDGVLDRYTVDI